jgi:hypothetical protein
MADALKPVPKLRRVLAGTVRVGAYVFLASLGCAALGARVVYADFQQASLQVGRELGGLSDVLGNTTTLGLNGVVMNVSSAFTDQSPSVVLDRFEEVCRAHPEMMARALADIPETVKKAAPSAREAGLHLGIVRKEEDGHGALTCFTDDRAASIGDVVTRLRSFTRTHDLSEFGRLRYVSVDRTPTGKTHVTTVWTDGRFNPSEMFPASGDSPGDDSAAVPRPPSAKRVFSGAAAGEPFGVRIYESGLPEADIRAFYLAEMPSLGWALVVDQPAHHAITYRKGATNVVYLTVQSKGDGAMVTITETMRTALPPAATSPAKGAADAADAANNP